MESTVSISLLEQYNKKWLKFVFPQILDEGSAKKAIEIWNAHFAKELSGNEKANLIFDCRQMKNYETASRLLWQKNMSDTRKQIGDIWIISENRLILAAAKTMGLLTGFKIKVTTLETSIYQEYR